MDSTRKRILIVDDEAQLRRLASAVLEQKYQVEAVASGAEALARMAERPFDLLLTDMVMPEMNGLELIARLWERYPAVACLIVSGNLDEDSIQQLQTAGIPHLAKPYRSAALLAMVRDIVERRAAPAAAQSSPNGAGE